jgi:hypothetical protein
LRSLSQGRISKGDRVRWLIERDPLSIWRWRLGSRRRAVLIEVHEQI